jgi:CRISPR system Cascade subunit CasD
MEPTKSGVIGVLAAALGVDRDDDASIDELAQVRLAVRVDREGILERDYHVTQNVPTTKGTGHRTVVSERYYLADALFLVVLEGDELLLNRVADAVANPHWRLFFGRKAYVPARPLLQPGATPTSRPLDDVIAEHGWLEPSRTARTRARMENNRLGLRTITECRTDRAGTETRNDQPISFTQDNRRFAPRAVIVSETPLTDAMIAAGDPLCS